MFSKASDLWETPQAFFDELHAEFLFDADAAATKTNRKCSWFFGPDHDVPENRDALAVGWGYGLNYWLNPPYSKCREFIAKAATEARSGNLVVCLVPARTDTRWWFAHVWDARKHQPQPGVEVRFIRGRLKFGDGKNSAPFPSVIVIFRGSDRSRG